MGNQYFPLTFATGPGAFFPKKADEIPKEFKKYELCYTAHHQVLCIYGRLSPLGELRGGPS
jgi:hypothetical protein